MESQMSSTMERLRARRFTSTLLVLITLTVGILIGTVISRTVKGKEAPTAAAAPLQIPAPQQLSTAFGQVAKQLEPSVVNINTETNPKPQARGNRRGARPAPDDQDQGQGQGQGQDPFQDFFDHFFGGQGGDQAGPGGGGRDQREHSLGSGVIMDSKGFIVTNAHVVDRADRIRVKLMDDPPQTLHEAKVIGIDRETDLAVIKIEVNRPLPAAKLGNSDSTSVGDWVLAIGSPFGLDETVTAGIISSKNRPIDRSHQFQSFLQTDAAINPGNSGGPLVNMNSEVIGINTAIYTQSYGYQGVGFALPSNMVANVYNQLTGAEHKVTRGSIGVAFIGEPSPALNREYGIKNGVLLSDVTKGGPADKAGLKVEDAIVTIDGKSIKNGDELVNEISSRKPGSNVKIGYVRQGKESTATLTVADRAKLYADRGGEEDANTESAEPVESKWGVTVHNITPAEAERLGIAANTGVLVTEVKPRSIGEDLQLDRGQVILKINKTPINSEEDFRRIQNQLKSGDDVAILVRTGRGKSAGTYFLSGTLP